MVDSSVVSGRRSTRRDPWPEFVDDRLQPGRVGGAVMALWSGWVLAAATIISGFCKGLHRHRLP